MGLGGTITRCGGRLSRSSATLAAAGLGLAPRRARAQRKTLRIMQWRHFVPAYDPWFNETFARQWCRGMTSTSLSTTSASLT